MGNGIEAAPQSGKVPVAIGMVSVVRIPVPGSEGLCIELSPRGYVPAGGSTSTLFFQDKSGRRHLRLDYGYNVKTRTIDYHWNQKGTHSVFGLTDHSRAPRSGAALYHGARYFRYAGRVLIVAGAAVDLVSIARSNRPLRRATEVATAWASAWVGCKIVGGAGAGTGTLVAPGPGTAVGGIAGCIIGGVGGYIGGESFGGQVYDWAEGTVFTALAEEPHP